MGVDEKFPISTG